MQTFTKKSIKTELLSKLEPNQEFTLNDAYKAVTSTDKKTLHPCQNLRRYR